MVPRAPENISPFPDEDPPLPRPPNLSGGQNQAARSRLAPSHGLVFGWASEIECPSLVSLHAILTQSRKDSTTACYLAECRHFCTWVQRNQSTADILVILDYFLPLKNSRPSISLLQVDHTVISSFLPLVDGLSVFTHLTTIRFVRGLVRTFPPVVKHHFSGTSILSCQHSPDHCLNSWQHA